MTISTNHCSFYAWCYRWKKFPKMKIHRHSLKKNFFPQRCIPRGMGSVSNTVKMLLTVRAGAKPRQKKWLGQFERAYSRDGHRQPNLPPNQCSSSDFEHCFLKSVKNQNKKFRENFENNDTSTPTGQLNRCPRWEWNRPRRSSNGQVQIISSQLGARKGSRCFEVVTAIKSGA